MGQPKFNVYDDSPRDRPQNPDQPLNFNSANQVVNDENKQETTYVNPNNSLSNISLRDRVDKLIEELEQERIKSEYSQHAPWKFSLTRALGIEEIREGEGCVGKIQACVNIFGRFLKYSIPPLVVLLIIIANTSREDRKETSEECILSNTMSNTTAAYSLNIDYGINNNMNNTIYGDCFDYENDGVSDSKPPGQGWKIALSLIPFVCVFQGVLGYDLSSRYVAPFTLFVTIYLGMVFFEDEGWWDVEHDIGNNTQGNAVQVSGLVFLTIVDRVVWTVFEYAFNVFTAFFFLRVLEYWGVVDQS